MSQLLIDPMNLLLASLIMFVGALTQSLIGFGLAVVAAPLLYLVDASFVPAPVIIMGFSISLLTLFRERRSLQFNGLQYALIGRIPGGFIGAFLLLAAPQSILGLAIALIVGLAVMLSWLKFNVPVNRVSLFFTGILSGVFANVSGIGGPPMAILLSNQESNQFRAALSTFFIFSSTISIVILGITGLLTLKHFYLAALLLPSVIVGHMVAGRLINHIDKQKIRVMTLTLCSVSALTLAVKSLITFSN